MDPIANSTSIRTASGAGPARAGRTAPSPAALTSGSPSRPWELAKVVIGVASLSLAALGLWLNRGPLLVFASGSDFLYLPALYRDWVGHAYPIRGWWVTPAPYFVPDMPLFFVAMAVTPTVAAAFTLYAELAVGCILGDFIGSAGWSARRGRTGCSWFR